MKMSNSGKVMISMLICDHHIEELQCYQHAHPSPGVMSGESRTVAEWAEESIRDHPSFFDDLKIPKEGWHHVLAEIELQGEFDYWGEYNEDIKLLTSSIQAMPDPPPTLETILDA